MLTARPTMAEKKTEHFLSPNILRPRRVLLCPPPRLCTTIPPYHGHQHGRRPALPPGHGALLLSGQQQMPKSFQKPKAVVTTRGGSTLDSLVVDWTRPLSQASKPSKQVVYKSEPPVRPPPSRHRLAVHWRASLLPSLFASSTCLQMWGSASKSQSDAAQPTSVASPNGTLQGKMEGPAAEAEAHAVVDAPRLPPLLRRPHWPRGNGKQMVI